MLDRDRDSKISVFVIGPMGKDKAPKGGVAIDEHIPNIMKALEGVKKTLKKQLAGRELEIDGPGAQEAGNFADHILPSIDAAEIGVADITHRTPSVMYELSLMHSLGIPVIILEAVDDDKAPYTPPFYLNQQTISTLTDFSVPSLRKVLLNAFKKLLSEEKAFRKNAYYQNAITRHFDGIALVDASASAGLAIGQFYNFIRYVIQDGGLLTNTDLEYIAVLRPQSINFINDMEREVEKRFGKLPRDVFKDSRHPRGQLTYTRIGRYVIDYPTPLLSVTASPRYIKYTRLLSREKDPWQLRSIEQQYIYKYFQSLETAVRVNVGTDFKRIITPTIDEFEQLIRSETP